MEKNFPLNAATSERYYPVEGEVWSLLLSTRLHYSMAASFFSRGERTKQQNSTAKSRGMMLGKEEEG